MLQRASKKGQITVFIIIGLVVVILIALLFTFRGKEVTDSLSQNEKNLLLTEKVSSDFRPLQDFVDSCIYNTAKEGIRLVGLQGGYIDTSSLLADKNDPTSPSSNSIYYWPEGDSYKIAYWWYMDSKQDCFNSGTCSFNSKQPDLTGSPNSIEAQLENYISTHVKDCLSDFSVFKDQGFEFSEKREPRADVTIGTSDVFVNLDYPFRAEKQNRKQDLNFFNVKLDVNLRDTYELAQKIAKQEAQNAFLEMQVIELIALNSGSEEDSLLPPFYQPSAFPINPRQIWTKTEVSSYLSSLLSSYVPFFQVLESQNFKMLSTESGTSTDAILQSMILPLGDSYFFHSVVFDYRNWWGLYLNIGQSEILTPTRSVPDYLLKFPVIGNVLSSVLPYNYQFAYDVSYPVVVTTTDDRAFNGEGFVFNIALESNVRNNLPVTESDVSFDDMDALYDSMFCNEEDYESGTIRIYTHDANGVGIPGTKVSFESVGTSCIMGLSEEHDDGVYFESKFPLAVGGILTLEAPGYITKKVVLTTQKDTDLVIDDIVLNKVQTKKVALKIFRNQKGPNGWAINPQPVDLRPSETAFISLKRIKETAFDDDFQTVIYFTSNTENPTIDLIPGTYTVEGNLQFDMSYENDAIESVVIPEQTESPCFLNIMCDPVTYPEIVFDSVFPEGTLFIDDEHGGTWELTNSELSKGDTATFYIIASPYVELGLSMSYDDMDEIGKSDYYSTVYYSGLIPCIDTTVCNKMLKVTS